MADGLPAKAQYVRGVETELKAMDLRRQGYSYREIGDELGCSHVTARACVIRAFRRAQKASEEMAVEIVSLELERLDEVFKAIYPLALNRDLQAVDRVVAVMKRRASLLGLDKPTKTETHVTGEPGSTGVMVYLPADGTEGPEDPPPPKSSSPSDEDEEADDDDES
jgi:hypothetical protein